MRHVPDGTLRRLVDEPMAVADADRNHATTCRRCRHRAAGITADATDARSLLAGPRALPDVDAAWRRHQTETHRSRPAVERTARRHLSPGPLRRVLLDTPTSRRAVGVLAGAVALAAAASVLSVTLPSSSPSRPTTSATSPPDIQAIASIAGIDGSRVLGGFSSPDGSLRLPFGVLTWSSAGAAHQVSSLGAAARETGLALRRLSAPPPGVGEPATILVQPAVTATIVFGQAAGAGMTGTSMTVTAGPAVLVEYGGSLPGLKIPTLATFTVPRPPVTSTSSSPARLEAYVLSQPSLPTGLAQELRLLGGLADVLPLPSAAGAQISQVDIGGTPGVLVTDSSIGVSGVVWVDGSGVIHGAVGLLDGTDILDVAHQLG